MKITEQEAQQFLDAINDYLSDGYIRTDAISVKVAAEMTRNEMDEFLFVLFSKVLELKP